MISNGKIDKEILNIIDGKQVGTFFTKIPHQSLPVDVQAVKGNQAYYPANYDFYGFRDVASFSDIRSQDCWVLDVEVAADGTKTFD